MEILGLEKVSFVDYEGLVCATIFTVFRYIFPFITKIHQGVQIAVCLKDDIAALAAIGLNTSISDFRKAGLAPMFYGITIDTLVTLTALVVILFMGLM